MLTVGLDVHKRMVEAVILDEQGHILNREGFPATRRRLEQFARQRLSAQDRVALEATTNTWGVVAVLKPQVAEVVVSNPLRTRAIAAAKVKTDRVDALVLAQLLRSDFLPRVWEPDERMQQMRHLATRRASLVSDRTRIKNRIHAVLHQRLIPAPQGDLPRGPDLAGPSGVGRAGTRGPGQQTAAAGRGPGGDRAAGPPHDRAGLAG